MRNGQGGLNAMDRAVELEDEVAWELLGEWERDGGTGESWSYAREIVAAPVCDALEQRLRKDSYDIEVGPDDIVVETPEDTAVKEEESEAGFESRSPVPPPSPPPAPAPLPLPDEKPSLQPIISTPRQSPSPAAFAFPAEPPPPPSPSHAFAASVVRAPAALRPRLKIHPDRVPLFIPKKQPSPACATPPPPAPLPAASVIVSNLSSTTSQDRLFNLFSQYERVVRLRRRAEQEGTVGPEESFAVIVDFGVFRKSLTDVTVPEWTSS